MFSTISIDLKNVKLCKRGICWNATQFESKILKVQEKRLNCLLFLPLLSPRCLFDRRFFDNTSLGNSYSWITRGTDVQGVSERTVSHGIHSLWPSVLLPTLFSVRQQLSFVWRGDRWNGAILYIMKLMTSLVWHTRFPLVSCSAWKSRFTLRSGSK